MVVEDEGLTMELICRLLRETGRVEVMGGFVNPIAALEYIFEYQPQAVFLDIEMPELSGLQLAEKIYESDFLCEIVFITGYNDYALEAFKVNALDYLLKPVLAEELERAVTRVEKRSLSQIESSGAALKAKIAVFGGFTMWAAGRTAPIKWPAAKCRELMAYFVFQGAATEVSKWKLIEMLWPDRDSEKGDINLRSTLCRLNKTLRESGTGIRVVSNRNSYYLKADRITVDAWEMQNLALNRSVVDKINLAEYQTVVASYQGALLEGFGFLWSEELRVRWQRFFTGLAHKLAAYYMEELKDHAAALNTVEALLRHEPYDEEAHCLAFKLYGLTKGRAASEAYYQRLSAILEEDLGVSPGSAVRELFKEEIKP